MYLFNFICGYYQELLQPGKSNTFLLIVKQEIAPNLLRPRRRDREP